MTNWKNLNKKFDEIIANITDKDWDKWKNNREKKRQIYREKLIKTS